MHRKLSLFLGLLLFGFAFSQQPENRKEQLQKQNAELKKQIANINAELAKAKGETKLSLAYLASVNQKITLREKVVNNTQKEKRFIEDDIYKRQLEINKFNRELKVLRKDYADILVKAYKNKGVQNKVTFVLSSKNLGEAIRRVQYIKQYGEYQDKKAAEISDKANQIKTSINQKQKSVKEKDALLNRQKQDLVVIEKERKDKEVLLQEFKKNEAKLTSDLRTKQAENKKIEASIRSIINEEIRIAKVKEEADKKAEAERIRIAKEVAAKEKAKIEAAKKAEADRLALEKKKAEEEERKLAKIAADKEKAEKEAKVKNDAARIAITEKEKKESDERLKVAKIKADEARNATKELEAKTEKAKDEAEQKVFKNFDIGGTVAGSNFSSYKGRMSFPVASGTIIEKFGKQPHPVFPGIIIENNGIKIKVAAGAKVKSVFPGTVSKVSVVGGVKTVMIKHGSYFTIYVNLENLTVSQGQQVSAGTQLGSAGTDLDGINSINFEIWNSAVNPIAPLNPMDWVSY